MPVESPRRPVAGVALLALALAFFVLVHARHSRGLRHGRTGGSGGALALPRMSNPTAPPCHAAASTGHLADAARSDSSHSQASALKAFLDGNNLDPHSYALSLGSSSVADREPHAQQAALLLGRHAATASSVSAHSMHSLHSGSVHSGPSREDVARRPSSEPPRPASRQGSPRQGSSRQGSSRQGSSRQGSSHQGASRQGSSIRDLRESVNNAVADVQGELSCEEPSFKVFSVLGQGGFGTVYHGALSHMHARAHQRRSSAPAGLVSAWPMLWWGWWWLKSCT